MQVLCMDATLGHFFRSRKQSLNFLQVHFSLPMFKIHFKEKRFFRPSNLNLLIFLWIYYVPQFYVLKTERKGLKFEGYEKTSNKHSFESGNGYDFYERVFGNVYKIEKYTSFWLSNTVILLLEMCPIAIVTYLGKNTCTRILFTALFTTKD